MTNWKVWAVLAALAIAGVVVSYYHGKSVQRDIDKKEWEALAAQPPVVKRDTVWVPGKVVKVREKIPVAIHDTTYVDTTQTPKHVVFDDTINGVWLGIEYETPTQLHPLGVFTAIDVKCPDAPVIHDSVTVHVPVPYEVKVTDWKSVSFLSLLGSAILYIAFVLAGSGS